MDLYEYTGDFGGLGTSREQRHDGWAAESQAGVVRTPRAVRTPDSWDVSPPPPHLVHTPTTYERRIKPVIDWVGAAVLCIVAAPVLVLIAVGVLLTLGSPILIRQERVGRDGVTFGMLKFRTMHPDRRGTTRSEQHVIHDRRLSHKRDDDPRHVPFGRFLRKWSLDELPQLINILRGEMSLVGPRPELATVVHRYEPWQHARHQVKPGLTGWWQVTERDQGLMLEHTRADLRYLNNVRLKTDLKLLLMTVPAVLGKMRGL
ncbi:MAG: sugar transferase [Nitriliruptorales bacterium]|nr:sugar transferase [Nitriliruptorales bacterium]